MVLLLVALLVQALPCSDGERLQAAAAQAQAFDVPGAADAFNEAARRGCPEARLTARYLRALQLARDAYRSGGDEASVAPVREAIAAFDGEPPAPHTPIMRTVLLAAVAAAQSERDDLALLLEHAVALEARLLAAGGRGAPGVTAHEAAGDLWLQVHRFETARAAYEAAGTAVGVTPRIRLGLARTAARLVATPIACGRYRELVAAWTARNATPPEIAEARAYVATPACAAAAQ